MSGDDLGVVMQVIKATSKEEQDRQKRMCEAKD